MFLSFTVFFCFLTLKADFHVRISVWSSDVCSSHLGTVAVAGGIIFEIIAIEMVTGLGKNPAEEDKTLEDPEKIAIYPLAVPYMLTPVGITVLLVPSREVVSIARVEIGRESGRERVCTYV